jgi:hypothetical protein
VKNSGRRAKQVLIEYPVDANWTLLAPEKPEEKTRDRYRFAVNAEPGKPSKLDVREERVTSQQIALTNLDDNTIRYYMNARVVSEAVKRGLGEVIARKQKISELAAEKGRLQQQVQVIEQEQNRIRQNMAQLDHNTDLYKRYVKKLDEQESENDRLRSDIRRLDAEEAKARQALDAYLISLNLD